MLVAEPTSGGKELGRAGNHAAFALHRLQDERAHVVATFFQKGGFETRDIVVPDMGESGWRGPESLRIFRLPTGGDREKRAAMKGVDRRHDAKFLGAEMIVRIASRELERRLVRFGAGAAKE